jgi:hypothetical protein
MKQKLSVILLTMVSAASSLVLPILAYAQTPTEGINLQISPLPIELTTKPGTSTSSDLRVRNAGSKTEKLQVRLLKVSEDNNGIVHLSNPGPTDEFTKWVSFDRPTFNAPSNEWQTIKMAVNVPKTAAFGYYFAVEYLRASDTAPQPGKTVTHGAVATFILLNADAPGAKREAQVTSFTADRKSYEFLPATFTVKVKNTGNVHVAPHGNVFITKGGKQVGVIAMNASEGNVLPNGSRFFESSWSDGFPIYTTKTDANGTPLVDKNGKPKKSLKWDFSHANRLRFGHYTAHMVMVYDNGERDVPIEAVVSFWVVPWRVLFGLLVIGIFVAIGVWSTLRKSTRFVKKHTGKGKHA